MRIEHYKLLSDLHPETAPLRNTFAAYGVTAPHTGAPFTEAMLFGIGGGLGIGYILWEFQQHNFKVMVLGFRNGWQYPRFLPTLCERLGAPLEVLETAGRKAAATQLDQALAQGRPAIAWVDLAQLPWLCLPASLEGHLGHVVGIFGFDEARNAYRIDDRSSQPFHLDAETLASARARIGSFKHRLMVAGRPGPLDLPKAVRAGIDDCVAHLSQPSDSFSLPTIRKWAKMMTDTRNKKGWPVVFADRTGLFHTLRSLFESVQPGAVGGGPLRALYAEFLLEAAAVLEKPALQEVAGRYRELEARWQALGDAALPDRIEPFRTAKELLRERVRLLRSEGEDALPVLRDIAGKLAGISREANTAFPLSDAEVSTLFADLQERLNALYEGETAAIAALKEGVAG